MKYSWHVCYHRFCCSPHPPSPILAVLLLFFKIPRISSFNQFASVDVYTRKTFPNCKMEACIHDLRHYSRNLYFGRLAIFSESSGSRLGDPWQKALQTTIEPTLFMDFFLIPLSNTCSFVQPARNVKYLSIVKRAFVLVTLALWSTRPCWIIGCSVSTSDGPDSITKDRHCSKSSHWKLKMSMRKRFYFGVLT